MTRLQKLLSAYRNEIKGIAILWVVFFHAEMGLSGLAYDIQKIGYGGVDLMLFLMGFGLYHSLKKNDDLGGYMKRRARRLLPSYLPFCIVWLAVTLTHSIFRIGMMEKVIIIAGNLTMSAFFAGISKRINWYMSALAMVIIAAPFFYACLKEGKRWLLRAAALLAVLFVLGVSFVDNEFYMAASRLPVFALGMMFARPCEEKKNGGKWAALLGPAGVAGLVVLYGCFAFMPQLLNGYAMYWHPFVLIAPALCAGLGWLFDRLPSKLLAPVRVMGAASFEIFLFNAWLEVWGNSTLRFTLSWIDLWGPEYRGVQESIAWAFLSVVSILVGVLYHYAVSGAMKVIRRRKIS